MAKNTKSKATSQKEAMSGAQELYNFLFEACDVLRGPVSQDNFKDYIIPIYQIKDNDMFEKAYQYIEQYY